MKFYLENIKDVFAHLKSSEDGLSSSEAELRLRENGKNEFQKNKKTSIFVKFIKQIIDPMIIILLVAAVISASVAAIKHESFADVIIILAVVVINAILGVYQESKAEKSIEALQKMSAAKSNVIRDGKNFDVRHFSGHCVSSCYVSFANNICEAYLRSISPTLYTSPAPIVIAMSSLPANFSMYLTISSKSFT